MKKILFIIIISGLFFSCKKSTLELSNPNEITSETFWQNEDDVNSALAATYSLLRDVDGGFWGVRGVELSNGRGDDFFIRNDVSALYQLSTFTNNPDNATANSLFDISYRAIFRANQIMEKVPAIPDLSDEKRNAYIAEAKFLRGLNYFILVINFGEVPLRLTVPQSSEDYFIPKSTEEEVWDQIKTDFSDAAKDLPVSRPSEWVGRATRGAALGYLGKAHIYTQNWSEAETVLEQLTKSPFEYSLMPDYGDNFIPQHENNPESLFEIQLADVGGTDPWAGENANQAIGVTTAQEFAPAEVAGWFEVSFTDKLFTEFQKEKTATDELDPRMYVTMVWNYPGAVFYERPFSDFDLVFNYQTLIKKYQNWWQTNELTGASGAANYTSSNNERALRYADVLLLLGEAYTMQNKVDLAYPLINEIRNRADLPDLTPGMNQDKMMEEIRHQRMLEFAREGQRFYDLKRWGLLKQEITGSDKEGREFFKENKHEYFPIPQNEINSNPEMVQNPNW